MVRKPMVSCSCLKPIQSSIIFWGLNHNTWSMTFDQRGFRDENQWFPTTVPAIRQANFKLMWKWSSNNWRNTWQFWQAPVFGAWKEVDWKGVGICFPQTTMIELEKHATIWWINPFVLCWDGCPFPMWAMKCSFCCSYSVSCFDTPFLSFFNLCYPFTFCNINSNCPPKR